MPTHSYLILLIIFAILQVFVVKSRFWLWWWHLATTFKVLLSAYPQHELSMTSQTKMNIKIIRLLKKFYLKLYSFGKQVITDTHLDFGSVLLLVSNMLIFPMLTVNGSSLTNRYVWYSLIILYILSVDVTWI